MSHGTGMTTSPSHDAASTAVAPGGTSTATPTGGFAAWPDRPTAAQRTGAQHAVARLFDALAPQKPPARREGPAPAIQRHRSPTGCILQATTRALTVSWFPASTNDTTLGELQLITWQGTVSRPGSARRAAGGAVVVQEETFALAPGTVGALGATGDNWLWCAADGTTYDAGALAARCHALLEEDVAA